MSSTALSREKITRCPHSAECMVRVPCKLSPLVLSTPPPLHLMPHRRIQGDGPPCLDRPLQRQSALFSHSDVPFLVNSEGGNIAVAE